jgi:hypothetical protein
MNMKKYYFVSAIAALALASCANDDFLGEVPGNNPSAVNGKEISFSGEAGKMSRANKENTDAASALGSRFWVYGTKKISDTDKLVYNNYLVKYTDQTGTTPTTKAWQYSGLNNSNDAGDGNTTYNYTTAVENAYKTEQGLKFWDYSASSYTFTAFSAPSADLTGESPKIKVKKENDTYKITLNNDADVDRLYFSDKKTISTSNYKEAVQFTFRNIIAKVRVGMYTTIPGYTVQIKKFYTGDNQTTEHNDKFAANAENTALVLDGSEYIVSYNTDNTPKLEIPTTGRAASQATILELGSNLLNNNLGTSKDNVTFDKKDGAFTCFLPQTATDDMKIKVDYQLTSTDGSKETIDVKGATVSVGKDKINWKINHSYTYIFKISVNTNGTTGGEGSTVGLYPITFDAVVEDFTESQDFDEEEFKKPNSTTAGQQ